MRSETMLALKSQLSLCKDISTEEIKNAPFSIGDNKAPREDGFNAYFFKKGWNIFKEDLCAAVMEFFQ